MGTAFRAGQGEKNYTQGDGLRCTTHQHYYMSKNMRKIYGAMGSCKVPWPIGRKKEASSLMKPTRSGPWWHGHSVHYDSLRCLTEKNAHTICQLTNKKLLNNSPSVSLGPGKLRVQFNEEKWEKIRPITFLVTWVYCEIGLSNEVLPGIFPSLVTFFSFETVENWKYFSFSLTWQIILMICYEGRSTNWIM